MSYLQPASNNYFGFAPAWGPARVNAYVVSSSEGSAISIGDIVQFTTNLATVRIPTGAYTGPILGVAASPLAANAGSTAARIGSDVATLIKVYDDPMQVFVTCDTTSGLMNSTSIGKRVAVLTTGAVGDTGPIGFMSRMAISAVTASSAGTMKIIGLHPIESGFSTDAGSAGVAASVRKILVIPAVHYFGVESTQVITT